MKKILLITTMLFSNLAFAQIDIGTPGANPINKADEMKLKAASKNASYNGAIVGFAQICGFSPTEYGQVEALLFKNLNTVGLTSSEMDEMKETYKKSVEYAKQQGKKISQNECVLFGNEFRKIISTINGKK